MFLVCSAHFFGSDCNTPCGQCIGDDLCDSVTGHCPHGCQLHWTGPRCDGRYKTNLVNSYNGRNTIARGTDDVFQPKYERKMFIVISSWLICINSEITHWWSCVGHISILLRLPYNYISIRIRPSVHRNVWTHALSVI